MKFIVSSTALSSHLQAISRVINSKNALPILDCFLFELEDGTLSVTVSDSETTMVTTVEVNESDTNGRFAVVAKTLLDALKEIPEVDVKLLKLAQIMKGKVVTNDFNLNKVAGIKGVAVLNINELANALKPMVIPGEAMTVTLIKQGKDRSQAVAYLDDGTMIVVEDGRSRIGETVQINVTSVLQTAAGRMIFGKMKEYV